MPEKRPPPPPSNTYTNISITALLAAVPTIFAWFQLDYAALKEEAHQQNRQLYELNDQLNRLQARIGTLENLLR